MGQFQDIVAMASRSQLEFLVIGGLAVNFHGVARDTADLDLLVRRADHKSWNNLLGQQGYTVYVERPAFMQFSPPVSGGWPIDLMLVKDATFAPMIEAGAPTTMYEASVKVVSLVHLLALKLHALKHTHVGRYSKDLLDVENLIRANGVDLAADKTRQLFLKYGNLRIYEQLSRFLSES